jgi:hypothetical protein
MMAEDREHTQHNTHTFCSEWCVVDDGVCMML